MNLIKKLGGISRRYNIIWNAPYLQKNHFPAKFERFPDNLARPTWLVLGIQPMPGILLQKHF